MVRFAPVISSAAVARAQVNSQRARATPCTSDLSASAIRRVKPGKLPSLYPAISLKSLHSRETGPEFDHSQGTSHLAAQSSLNVSEPIAENKFKGTSLVVGAAGILRAATAFAVDNTTAETTVQQAEQQIEEPECEVNNSFIGLVKFPY